MDVWECGQDHIKKKLKIIKIHIMKIIYYDELRKTKKTCEKIKLEHIGYKCVNGNEIQKIK